MIVALDPGLGTFGWAIVAERTARVLALGVLLSDRDPELDESTDRARRVADQARGILALARSTSGVGAERVTAIAAEAMSFGGAPGARFAMAISLGLSWGALAGVATALDLPLVEIPPKRWQRAIVPDAGKRVDYDQVFAKLDKFVRGAAAEQLAAIPMRHRNHALDACGIGVFAALRMSQATRIRGAA